MSAIENIIYIFFVNMTANMFNPFLKIIICKWDAFTSAMDTQTNTKFIINQEE